MGLPERESARRDDVLALLRAAHAYMNEAERRGVPGMLQEAQELRVAINAVLRVMSL